MIGYNEITLKYVSPISAHNKYTCLYTNTGCNDGIFVSDTTSLKQSPTLQVSERWLALKLQNVHP